MGKDIFEEYARFVNRREFIIDDKKGRKRRTPSLSQAELNAICEYLENPTRNGVWYLRTDWHERAEITKTILGRIAGQQQRRQQNPKRPARISEMPNDSYEYVSEVYERVSSRLTFVFELFRYLELKNNEDTKSELRKYLDEIPPMDREILTGLDWGKTSIQYKEALDYFTNHISMKDMQCRVSTEGITRVKDGYFVMIGGLRPGSRVLRLASLESSPLSVVGTFLNLTGKVDKCKPFLLFSPEEEVFAPYLPILRDSYTHFIHNRHMTSQFKKAINQYEEREYSYCVGTLGLICEDYLTQVYETFFRETCPKRLTLGEVYDMINNRTRKALKSEEEEPTNLGATYAKIKMMQKQHAMPVEKLQREVLLLQKEMLSNMIALKEWVGDQLDTGQKRKERLSVFPEPIRDNIIELIKYRNATAHISRDPIGEYESLRSAYYCVSLAMWWAKEQSAIDWRHSPLRILKNAVRRNSKTV